MKRSLSIGAAILTILLLALGVATRDAKTKSADQNAQTKTRLAQSYARLPLRFEANAGQTDAQVRFLARGAGYALFLTPREAVLQLRRESATADLRMRWLAANPAPRIAAEAEQPGTTTYLMGRGRAAHGVKSFGRVNYESVWPGVDLVFYGNQQQLEYDFRLAPGARASRIRLAIDGAQRAVVEADGSLTLETNGQQARWLAPVAYQEINGARRAVDCGYRLTKHGAQHRLEFTLGAYDRRRPLVIDPVFVYSTALGGVFEDDAFGVAADEAGNTYVVGSTRSQDFPTANPLQAAIRNPTQSDAFILKIAPGGGSLVYGTFLGGTGTDVARAVAVDAMGNAYVAGHTDSADFPTAATGVQPTAGGFTEAFLVKLNPSGSQLIYSARLGGGYDDRALALAVDAGGNAYVAGQTNSTDFPVVGSTRTTDFTTLFKSTDAAANWNAAANGLPNATVRAITFNPTNNLEILAGTDQRLFRSVNGGGQWNAVALPVIGGGTVSVSSIVFDPKTPATIYLGTSVGVYKSVNGGQSFQQRSIGIGNRPVTGLVIDPVTPATLYAATGTGVFKSTDGGESWPIPSSALSNTAINNLVIHPTEPMTLYAGTARGVFKTVNGGTAWTEASNGLGAAAAPPGISALAIDPAMPMTLYAAVNAATGAVLFKTTDGGANWRASDAGLATTTGGVQMRAAPSALAISAITPATLYAATPLGLFKTTDGGGAWALMSKGITNLHLSAVAIDAAGAVYAGATACTDAFVAKVNPSGSALVYSMMFGGLDCDLARGLAVDATGAAWVTGNTLSANFPVVAPRQAQLNGAGDAFVAKVNAAGSALSFSTFLGGGGTEIGHGIALDAAGNAVVVGETASTNFPAANGFKTTPGGRSDGFIAKYKADGSAIEYAGYFGGNDSDGINAVAVDKSGNAWVTGASSSSDFPAVNPLPLPTDLFGTLFVARFSADGKQLLFSSLIRAGSADAGRAVTVDAANNVYVAGIANGFSFPQVNPVSPTSFGTPNGFALKLSPAADLAVTLADAPDPVLAGEQLTYTATVANRGDVPLTGIRLTDVLPQGTTPVSVTATQGACSGATTVTCDLGTLGDGATARVTIIVNAPVSATVGNTVTVTAAETEANTQNNSATAATQIVTADLALSVTPSLLRAVPGGRLSWLLTVRNLSERVIPEVRLSNTLPAGVTLVSCAPPATGGCGGAGNERTATLGRLAANTSATVMLTATVNGNVAPGTALLNTARLESARFDSNPDNNQAAATTMTVTPSAEPRNGLIAFSSSASGFFGINLIQPDGVGRFLLTEGNYPEWSPDGTQLLLRIGRPAYVVNADGTGLRQLTTAGDEDSPTWSPDGTRIAFYRFSTGLHIVNADGTGDRNVLREFQNRIGVTVKWSPDGTRLLVAESRLGGLFVCNIDGSGVTQLTRTGGTNVFDDQPDWSPDSGKIVFVSTRDTGTQLYTINADGSGLTRLTNTPETKRFPVWSPDGSKIAYAGGNDLVILNADGTPSARFPANVNNGLDWQRVFAPLPRRLVISGRLRNSEGFNFSNTMIEVTGTVTARRGTNNDGFYSFGLLPEGGNYTVRPVSTFFRFDPPSRTYTNLTADQLSADFTATRIRTLVRGRITDFAGAPMAGIAVNIGSTRTETDADGNYLSNDVSGGPVTITPASGQTNAQFEPAFITLPASENIRQANFKGIRASFRISGQVTTANNTGSVAVAGVSVSLEGGGRSATATTDGQGRYEFANLPGGFLYTVSAAKSGEVIAPAVRRVTLGRDLDLRFFAGVGALAGVSAASYSPQAVTVAGIVSLFGQGLSVNTVIAAGTTLPTTLDGVSVFLTNRNLSARQCRLFFVSPGQINAALPPIENSLDDAAIYAGEALVEVRRGTQVLAAGSIEIQRAAPAVFTADSSGSGFPLGVAVRVRADGSQVFEPVARFDSASGRFVAVPIDVSNAAEQVFLVLFATGLRFRGDPADVGLRIGNETAPITFAGAAPGQTGVDQVNALLPRSLSGSGEVQVSLTAGGKTANTVKLNFK